MEKPELLRLIWCVTKQCNFNCEFCYTHSGPGADYGLPAEDMLRIAEQINNSPAKHLSIIGGEPFVRKDLKAIVSALKPEITLTLDTNGSLLVGNWDAQYEKRFLHVSIGFDGAADGNEIYRKQTDKVVEAIRFLVQRGVKVMVPTIATARNCHNIRERIEFIYKLGVKRVQINKFSPVHGARNERELMTETQENTVLADISGLIAEKPEYGKFVSFSPWYSGKCFDAFGKKSLGSCFCGYWKASISAEGNFVPCISLCEKEYVERFEKEYEIPNLLKADINRWFSDSRLFKDVREAVVNYLPSTCKSCAYSGKCSHGCRVMSYFYRGSLKVHDPRCTIPGASKEK